MVEIIELSGYEAYSEFVKNLKTEKQVNILFSSDWCPDCVEAKPIISKALDNNANKDSIMVKVDVGDRPTWKDMENPFRKDKQIHLMVIPTLIRWKEPQRLEGDHLTKESLLSLFFENEE